MKRLRIGYQGCSPDLSHPGDRRRVVFWASSRGHEIVTDLNEKVDVILLSERADFGAFPKKARGVPIIFDLIDGYLAGGDRTADLFRGISKVLAGQLSGWPQPFTSFVENLCLSSSAVICSSIEQQKTIAPFSKNVHIILDSHQEFPMTHFKGIRGKKVDTKGLIWEGMPATLGGFKDIQPSLLATNLQTRLKINFVTNASYFQVLGKYIPKDTSSLVRKYMGELYNFTHIIPWSVDNLVSTANVSDLAIIPIDLASPLQLLKPENRLLIMWRLGLPCLTSPTPAYVRVADLARSDTICRSKEEWELKLNEILHNADMAESIVKRGQEYIHEFHNSEVILGKWDNAFQSIL